MPERFPYALERVGVIMRPEPGNPHEEEGVLNPAAVVAPSGKVIMYPRLVAKGNRSRIGRAEIVITDGIPQSIRREGILLFPDRGWEHGSDHGGVEDPRLTWIVSLGLWVMTYVAFGPLGPRGALLVSKDLENWERLGPIQYTYEDHLEVDLNLFPNKDLLWFPEPVTGPNGRPCYAFIHRPMWEIEGQDVTLPAGITDARASIWISYVDVDEATFDARALLRPWGHRQLLAPEFPWEALKIGGGPPPLRVPEGWLLLHHGVSGSMTANSFEPQKNVHYAAGAVLLDATDPTKVLARTIEPLLSPETNDEREGIVGNVVFPTAIIEVEGDQFVLYGMADEAIGVARIVRQLQADGSVTETPAQAGVAITSGIPQAVGVDQPAVVTAAVPMMSTALAGQNALIQ